MKIVASHFDPEVGVSVVMIQKNQDVFTGVTFLEEQDRDVASSYAGCTFAELKAKIQMARKQYKVENEKLKVIQNLYTQLTQLRDFEAYKHSQPVRHMRKTLRIQSTKVDNMKVYYEYLKEAYPIMVNRRLAAARAIPDVLKKSQLLKELTNESLEAGLEL